MRNALFIPLLLPFVLTDVIHTVGPIARGHINGSHKEDLANCYKSSLKLVKENNIRSVVSAFMLIITYPSSAFILWKAALPKRGKKNHFQNTKIKDPSKLCGLFDGVHQIFSKLLVISRS